MMSGRTGTDELCGALVDMLALFEKAQRRFHPSLMAQHGTVLRNKAEELARAMEGFDRGRPDSGNKEADVLMEACRLMTAAVSRFNASSPADLSSGVLAAMRAGRKANQALELLFGLRQRLAAADAYSREDQRPGVNDEEEALVHLGPAHDPYARGSASLYVPGRCMGRRPLVVALHGGYGHGRDFIWTWLRQARSRKFFLLAPTSQGQTWSITNVPADLGPLHELIGRLCGEHPINEDKVLLTGFSDGATFGLGCAMIPGARFSAFNPVSGVLPPGELVHVRSRRIFWIHGTFDWMFPVFRAKSGSELLRQAGADVTLMVKEDLAHAFPMEENPAVLSWFDPVLFP